MIFAYLILRLMSYFFCVNVDALSMGFGHRNCVFLERLNGSGQRLGQWAATTCELHGCNNGSSMCDYSRSRQKRIRNADYNGQKI